MTNNEQAQRAYLKENYLEIFKLKNNDFFGLLAIDFYLKEFLFFPRLMNLLASRNNLNDSKARNLGIVSTLVYLSAKIHYSVKDNKKTTFAADMQFPILLGDLLYGKVIEVLLSGENSDCLNDYLHYLQELNAAVVDHLNGEVNEEALAELRYVKLALLSADLLGVKDEEELEWVKNSAKAFAAGLKKENISSALEQLKADGAFAFLANDLKITSLEDLERSI